MAKLLKNKALVSNDLWQIIRSESAEAASAADAISAYSVVSLSQWQAEREQLLPLAQAGTLGVWLQSHETADLIADDAANLPLIAVEFPVFTDGRGYSTARLLRERYGFTGELRAIGDILIDQLHLLNRIGFDALALREDQNIERALNAFTPFSFAYQSDVQDKRPLWRRRELSA